jgi:hypothetical protein
MTLIASLRDLTSNRPERIFRVEEGSHWLESRDEVPMPSVTGLI